MSWLRRLLFRFQPLWSRQRIEAELSEELRIHLEMATAAHVAAGLSPEAAQRAAQLELGGVEQVKEAWRDERGLRWLAELRQDFGFGLRVMTRHRGFTAVVALSIGLGMGVSIVVFGLLNAVFLRPLPGVTTPARMVHLRLGHTIPYPEYAHIREHNQAFTTVAASAPVRAEVAIELPGGPGGLPVREPLRQIQMVSASYFGLLGARPALGRFFVPSDDEMPGGRPVIVLSEAYWRARLGGDPDIVGKSVRLEGVPFTIVGVAPEMAPREPGMFFTPQAWVPFAMADILEPARERLREQDEHGPGVSLIGQLKPGVSFAAGVDDLQRLELAYAHEFRPPDSRRELWTPFLEQGFTFLPLSLPNLTTVVTGIAMLAGIVLLVACANVASLLLARAKSREREINVRLALGASRGRIIRQLLTESLALALLGGFVAVLAGASFSQWLWPSVLQLTPTPELQRLFGFDWRMGLLAFAASTLAGLVFGLVPAFEASRGAALAGHGLQPASPRRWRTLLVGMQIAAAVTFLVLGGLALRMVRAQAVINVPFDPAQILFFETSAPRGTPAAQFPVAFQEALLDRIRSLPGVVGATIGQVWYGRALDADSLRIDDHSVPGAAGMNASRVGANYFDALGLRLLRGRGFTDAESITNAPVAVISESAAARFWPGQDPIGHRLRIRESDRQSVMVIRGQRETTREIDVRIIGVAEEGVRAIRNRHEYRPLAGDLYLPLQPGESGLSEIWIRTDASAAALSRLVPDLARRLDKEAVVRPRGPLSSILAQWRNETTVGAEIAAVLGALALLLSAIGVYGVMAHHVAQRTQEIGVRVAVGASRPAIIRLILCDGLRLIRCGALFGLAGSALLAAFARAVLYGLSPLDPVVFGTVTALIATIALTASWLPAWRASRIEPMSALRCE